MYEMAGRKAKLLFYRTLNDLASANVEEIIKTFCGKLTSEILKQETNILYLCYQLCHAHRHQSRQDEFIGRQLLFAILRFSDFGNGATLD